MMAEPPKYVINLSQQLREICIVQKFRPTLLISFAVGLAAFALSDGPEGYECRVFALPGSDKILGHYNGCNDCTSDTPHGDGSCGALAETVGSWCKLTDVADSYKTRSPNFVPCYCTETVVQYTYKSPDTSPGPCTVTGEGR